MEMKFTSSNGGTVKMLGNRRMIVTDTAGYKLNEDASVKSHSSWLDPAQIDTLREFFQHERDQELGRWRDPENLHRVAYATSPQTVLIMDESTGLGTEYSRQTANDSSDNYGDRLKRQSARAYFAAHPEPKPLPSEPHTAWVDKYGTDIWWVDGLGKLRCCASPSSDPAKYAPFTRLVQEVSDGA